MFKIQYRDLCSKKLHTHVFDSERERDEFIEYGDMIGHLDPSSVKYIK